MIISLQKYQDRSIPFRAWLYRIARNLLLDSHRRLKFRSPLPLEAAVEYPVDTVSPERAAERTLTLEKVSRALERLAPNQREVVELRFLAGLDLEEVAEVIDKSVSAVKGLQHRGLTAIRDILKE
jgi:RNA polymerase sigma-70 factor (ECF subfamily)